MVAERDVGVCDTLEVPLFSEYYPGANHGPIFRVCTPPLHPTIVCFEIIRNEEETSYTYSDVRIVQNWAFYLNHTSNIQRDEAKRQNDPTIRGEHRT